MRYSAIASIRRAAIFRSTAATARTACRRLSSATSHSIGATIARPMFPGRARSFMRPTCAACTMLRHDLRANERGTFAALGDPETIDYLRRSASRAIELLPIHAFVQDRASGRARVEELLGLQHDRLLSQSSRVICRTVRATKCASPCASCTPPASKSFLTWFTIIPRKAANSVRRCHSAASIMPVITGSYPTTSGTASTTPGPATRSIYRIRACCKW